VSEEVFSMTHATCFALLLVLSNTASFAVHITDGDAPVVPVDKLIGKWTFVRGSSKTIRSLEFAKNGKVHITGIDGDQTETDSGTWKLHEKAKLTISVNIDGTDITRTCEIIKLTAKELITKDSSGRTDTFHRKK
jgi:uncharacterized protein (TIGR03066 family)